jgi:putative spermidine/putrescine transport system ATP-binding protein
MNGVSLSVRPGSLTAILGPSGSGKSTMLSLIAGIAMPSNGSISIAGRDVTYVPSAQRNVGLVFQSYALFPHLSVYENVAFPLRIRRLSQAVIARQVDEALERVRLGDLKTRRPSQLSGGQQQRVAIARAIAFKPSVLLLDEPLAALDRKLREEVRLELRHLQRDLGITTVLVTHDQDEAMSMADEIVVMAQGSIQQIDTPRQAYRRPANNFVANFLGIANIFEGRLQSEGDKRHILIDGGERIAMSADAAADSGVGRVQGMLRPEQIWMTKTDAPGAVRARVDELIFLGESIRYLLTSEGGLSLTVQAANPKVAHQEGDLVGLLWDAGDVWVLPERNAGH